VILSAVVGKLTSMSLADEVRTVRQRVEARLRELEPLVREYDELRALASELGIEVPEHADPVAADAGTEERASSSGPRRRRARGNTVSDARRDERLLEALRSNPGATAAELATVLGVSATSLYRPIRDLTSSGSVVKRGRGLYAAEP
jgi:hypothetical protein